MVWVLPLFLLAAAVALLQARPRRAALAVAAGVVWAAGLPLLIDSDPPWPVIALAGAIVLAPVYVGLFGQPAQGSWWVRVHADERLSFAGRLVGGVALLLLLGALALAFALENLWGGAVLIGGFAVVTAISTVRDELGIGAGGG